jgi:hypothetical protein
MTRLAPRLRVHKDRTVTISGIPLSFAKSIFTAASLNHYESEKRHRAKEDQVKIDVAENKYGLADVIQANYADEQTWMRTMRYLVDFVDRALKHDPEIDNIPVTQLDAWQRQERLRRVRDDRNFRHKFDRLMAEVRAGKNGNPLQLIIDQLSPD